MTTTSRTVEQTNHRLIRDALRETLQAGPGATEEIGSLRYRASAVLYLLLLEHPLDGRGRCWSCPGVLRWLRPRPCQIHVKASEWLLHHPDEVLRSHLAREFGRTSVLSRSPTGTPPRTGLTVKARPDPRDTDVAPGATGEPRPDPARTPGPRGNAPFHRRLVRRLSTRSPDAPAPDGQPATTPDMR